MCHVDRGTVKPARVFLQRVHAVPLSPPTRSTLQVGPNAGPMDLGDYIKKMGRPNNIHVDFSWGAWLEDMIRATSGEFVPVYSARGGYKTTV